MSPRIAAARDPLIDGFGRAVTDLRISVTDKCNFRCTYCMPAEGLPWLDKAELLTFEEIARIVSILVTTGVTSIKLTGGEPLVRRDITYLVAMLRQVGAELDISITTNGYLLSKHARSLKHAGLDRVTVSCDSLLKHRFAEITLRDALDEVHAGLTAAEAAELGPIKINCVVIRGVNDDEIVSFAELSRATGWDIRFIEYMPLDARDAWRRAEVVPAAEILSTIHRLYPLVAEDAGAAPATRYSFADGAPGSIGVIASVTEPFCASCNRLRLTADGQVRACLFALEETDVKSLLRGGASDDDIYAAIAGCVASKWAGHHIGQPDFVKPSRSMSMIGG